MEGADEGSDEGWDEELVEDVDRGLVEGLDKDRDEGWDAETDEERGEGLGKSLDLRAAFIIALQASMERRHFSAERRASEAPKTPSASSRSASDV